MIDTPIDALLIHAFVKWKLIYAFQLVSLCVTNGFCEVGRLTFASMVAAQTISFHFGLQQKQEDGMHEKRLLFRLNILISHNARSVHVGLPCSCSRFHEISPFICKEAGKVRLPLDCNRSLAFEPIPNQKF